MAERLKDEQDRLLESMFASERIADDGFSSKVVHRIRRKFLLRRITLPVAALLGGVVAFKPIAALVGIFYQLLQQMPDELVSSVTASLPTLQLVVTGGLLLLAAAMALSMLED